VRPVAQGNCNLRCVRGPVAPALTCAISQPSNTLSVQTDGGFNIFVGKIGFDSFNPLTVKCGLRSVKGAGVFSTLDAAERRGKR